MRKMGPRRAAGEVGMIGALDRLSVEALRRAVTALDSNRNRTIEFPELDIPGHLADRMDALPGDRVRISDMVKALQTGAVRIPVAGVWDTAETLAKAIDANHNGRIDASEVRFSPALRARLASREDQQVTTDDLAQGFYNGTLDLAATLG
jgi:hypothetical protein